MPNRLQHETSPYLRQHADNPVEWWPWSEDALAAARTGDKPILLSIGYSACHWCHVMAHESFEDEETARLMNERFVCVKVDREEMPDVDQIYQQALQLQGEHGGWPLTMFLTPEGVPYFGGTYFPKRENFGRPSFKRLLVALSDAYRDQRDAVADNARQYREGLAFLAKQGRDGGDDTTMRADAVDRAATKLAMRIDRLEGGFQGAPKFPNPKALELILRGARRAQLAGDSDAPELLRAVVVTLLKMAEGGIYDQLGGGFARYSTDAHWLVPHFEKMLYDNAQLLSLYAHAYQLSGHATFPRVMRETAAYLERDLRAPEGGLYTAEDADSEGVEGKFYVWTPAELAAVLDADEARVFARCFDVSEGGNWSDPHGHGPEHASILHVVDEPRDDGEVALIASAKRKLLDARSKRVRPGLDDKVLASSNGLAIAGLAEAGRVLGDRALVDGARRTAEFVLERMRDASGRLRRTFKGGDARLPGTLDDHALVADGLIALYEATGEGRFLEEAHALTRLALELFYDQGEAAFYLTAASDAGLIQRPVSTFDSAVPSGMSVCLENLIRLGDACGEKRWLEVAERVLRAHYDRALENPFGFSNLIAAIDLLQSRPTEIVLAGSDVAALERAIAGVYLPSRVIARAEGAPKLLAALVDGKSPVDGKAAAYVCRDFACERPETDPAALAAALSRR
jgi:uncharacterized protein YyaL (SSP411 family)